MSTPAPPQDQHHVRLEQFEGPLDLLLFLIRRSEVNIYDIPIHQITEQYLQYLEYATRLDLDEMTEFYGMAATLLLIKSRMLLPSEIGDDDEEDPRRELVERLIEYQRFRKLSELVGEKAAATEWVIQPRRDQRAFDFVGDEEAWRQIDVWDLLQTFSAVMSRLAPQSIIDLYEEVTINEKLSLIYEFLDSRGEFLFTDIVVRPESVMDVVCAFLAVLEAVKARSVRIHQNAFFGDIRISVRERPA